MKNFRRKGLFLILSVFLTLTGCDLLPTSSENSSQNPPMSQTSSQDASYRTTFYNYDDSFLYATWTSHGETATYKGPTPIKPATNLFKYSFRGWDKSLTNIQSDTTFKAQFDELIINYYDVSFHNYDDSLLYSTTIPEGGDVVYKGPTPTRPNDNNKTYTFIGWNKSLSNITNHTIFVAQYSAAVVSHLTRFVNYDGSLLDAVYVLHGDTAVYSGAMPIRPNTEGATYTFTGWDKSLRNITSDIIFTAQFRENIKTFVVTFYNYDGEFITEKTVNYGDDVEFTGILPTKKIEGKYSYKFSGWDKPLTDITTNLDVYAVFVAQERLTTEGVWFEFNSNKLEYMIVGYSGSEKDLFIGRTHTTLEYGTYPIRTIREYAFQSNYSFETVYLDSSITTIGNYAFNNCGNLRTVTLSSNLASIGEYAFQSTNIQQVEIPASVQKIGRNAFAVSSGKCEIVVSENNPFIAVENLVLYNKNKTILYATLGNINKETLIIPEGVESIEENALNYTSVKYLSLPSTLKIVRNYAFAWNYSLQEVTFNNSPTKIEGQAFYQNNALNKVNFGNQIKEIYNYAFSHSILKEIQLPKTIEYVSTYSFADIPSLENVIYDTEEGEYRSLDGILYNKQMTEVIIFPPAKEGIVTLASSLTYINPGQFIGNKTSSFVIENNDKYMAVNDIVYSKDGKTLIIAPGNKKNVVIKAGTTQIGQSAFQKNQAIKSVIINDELTSIGMNAFKSTSLTEIEFGARVKIIEDYAFQESKLVNVQFNESIETIRSYAFSNILSLENLVLPGSLKLIDYFSFSYLPSLETIAFNEGLETIGAYAFLDNDALQEIRLPNSLKLIEYNAFNSCEGLEKVYFGEELTNIRFGAFSYCRSLNYVEFGSKIKVIESDAFSNCAFESFVIPSKVTKISEALLAYNSRLKEIEVHDNVDEIGYNAFYYCELLEEFTFPPKVQTIAFNTFYNNRNLKKVTFNDRITAIGSQAFYNCYALEEIKLGKAVITIYDYAFYQCRSLKNVTLNDGLTTIGYFAFYYCTSLERVIIPSSVIEIDVMAFGNYPSTLQIFYQGNAWNSVLGSFYEDNLYYYSEEPNYTGNYWHYDEGTPRIWEIDEADLQTANESRN